MLNEEIAAHTLALQRIAKLEREVCDKQAQIDRLILGTHQRPASAAEIETLRGAETNSAGQPSLRAVPETEGAEHEPRLAALAEPEMVTIPAGSFLMGSPEDEPGRYSDEGPQHVVTFTRPFEVGTYAVTFDEWDAYVRATGAYSPSDEGWGRGRRPVINVSWHDVQAYIRWLNSQTGKQYRLPSEAEWEYACRAGTTTAYSTGMQISEYEANFSGRQTAPVGSYAPNAFGLYDMHGNVWEWCEDCWNESYSGAPTDGSAWVSGNCSLRVYRGGSWVSGPRSVRSAGRNGFTTGYRYDNLGFRLARTLEG